jgi:glycosyltransferase involved in cell wall biosynthesis
VISEHLAAWCEAQGIPRAKLHLVRNAPGYASAGGPARALRDGPMRVLFLGRLDAQKGADRLPAIMAATAHLPIEWRIAGRAVLGGGVPWLRAEPPATTPAALDALYGWADVVILPSRFEGVPLTVLEAQRMGCAVVATDTGALREIVVDGRGRVARPARGRRRGRLRRGAAPAGGRPRAAHGARPCGGGAGGRARLGYHLRHVRRPS